MAQLKLGAHVMTLVVILLLVIGCNLTADRAALPESPVTFTAVARYSASLSEGASAHVTMHFRNNADVPITFLLGRGTPHTVFEVNAKNTPIILRAHFICPFEYEHDCFHAESLTLEPGQTHDDEWDIGVPERFFSHEEGYQLEAAYITLRDREASEPLSLTGSITFYRRWHGISAEEGYTVSHAIPTPSEHTAGIAFDGAALWSVDSVEKKVYKLDPQSGEVLDAFATPGSLPAGLCWDGQNFFLSDTLTHRIYRCKATDFTVIASFATPGQTPIGLACDNGYLWHVDHDLSKIFKMDPQTGEVLDSVTLPDGRHMGIAFAGDHLWIVDGLRRLLREVDIISGDIVKEVDVVTPYPVSLTSWGDDVYFADTALNKIYTIHIKE